MVEEINQDEFEKNLYKFLNTAIERHNIYINKERGVQKPWTTDEVYKQFFFCNVFRQYDKCSKWIIENIIPIVEVQERWDLIILFRFISTMNLFLEIQKTCNLYDLQGIQSFLCNKKARGERLFSSCFIRNPRIVGGWTDTYKVPFHLIKAIKMNGAMEKQIRKNSLESLVDYLKQFPGVGGFMAYEYACDLEYSNHFNPTDKLTWANPGPGARKGLSLLLHGCIKKINLKLWSEYTPIIFKAMEKRFKKEFPKKIITMREVEHWLCEFQKYVKYKNFMNGENRIKHRKYNGVLNDTQ